MRRTRLIATLGPATDSLEKLTELVEAGVDTFRLNMSHASHEWVRDVAGKIRSIPTQPDRPVGILVDLQGPSIRTGDLEKPYQLKVGEKVEFRASSSEPSLPTSTTVNYEGLFKDVIAGNKLIVDNGALLMTIDKCLPDRIICTADTEGPLGNRRHINLPGTRLNLPALTEKDHADIQIAAEIDTDFVAGSFVRDAGHVRELRQALQAAGCYAQIISKLEDQEAIRNLESIVTESDLIMVARGDLGIEVNIEELPIIQRRIIKECLKQGKRVIVATHMLESMIENPTPTRAEVTDVSNAVFEQADAIMVSGETSVGKYPVECIEIMDRVSRRIERSGGLGYASEAILTTDKQKAVHAANQLADSIENALLLVFTRSGRTAHQSALLRPDAPIYAFTPDEKVRRSLSLSRGVRPFVLEFSTNPSETIQAAIKHLKAVRVIEAGTPLIVLSDTFIDDHSLNSILLEYA